MLQKKVCVDGVWCFLNFYKEDDGSIKIEVEQQVSGKRHNVFPDNKIQEFDNDRDSS